MLYLFYQKKKVSNEKLNAIIWKYTAKWRRRMSYLGLYIMWNKEVIPKYFKIQRFPNLNEIKQLTNYSSSIYFPNS